MLKEQGKLQHYGFEATSGCWTKVNKQSPASLPIKELLYVISTSLDVLAFRGHLLLRLVVHRAVQKLQRDSATPLRENPNLWMEAFGRMIL